MEQVGRRTGSGGEQDHEERKETDKEEKWNGQVRDLFLAGWLPAAENLAVELKEGKGQGGVCFREAGCAWPREERKTDREVSQGAEAGKRPRQGEGKR